MRTTDPEDLEEELSEDLHLPAAAQASVHDALHNTTLLPYAAQLQGKSFFWPPPVLQTASFFISGIILFVASTATESHRPAYKASVLVGAALGAFGLGLALTEAVGSKQSLNSLVLSLGGGGGADEAEVAGLNAKSPVYILRGASLGYLQTALAVVVTLFYVFIDALFVRQRQ
ncbi:hypothetical protein PG993_013355 [Apiospora rasikravindrae]|uniref:Uncharacterized protein n=1 Tax=Apiospora rasikravindrae TaxID=990691 RepID=A0ABR1RXK9_9PEZI